MILLLLACIPSPTDLPASDFEVEPTLLPPHNLGATGANVHAAGDVNGDGYDDILVGDCSTNTVSLYFGGVQGTSSSPDWQDSGTAGFACSLAAAGDVNGDGYTDFMVADPSDSNNSGTVSLYVGGSGGPTFRRSWSGAPGEQLGTGLFELGDLNGDGYDDLGITAWIKEDTTTDGLDRLDVYYGGVGGPGSTADWSWQHQTVAGSSSFANAGLAVAALKLDSDSYTDLAITGTWDDGSGNSNQTAWLLGSSAGLSSPVSKISTNLTTGRQSLVAADLDGDGLSELHVLAANRLYGLSSTLGAEDLLVESVNSAYAHDLNGDGLEELALCVPTAGGQGTGCAPTRYDGDTLTPWLGGSSAPTMVPLGDLNGDGNVDVAFWDGDLLLWYGSSDADGDGFDSDGSQSFGQDCDDQNAAINPGAADTLGDQVDSDCDGLDGISSTQSSTCATFTTPAEALRLLDPLQLPLPAFGSLEDDADACGERHDFSPASLVDAAGNTYASAASSWIRSACTEATDGLDADGLASTVQLSGISELAPMYTTWTSDVYNRSLQVAVDPASGADPYAGSTVEVVQVDSSMGSSASMDLSWSYSERRKAHGYAFRQDGSTQVYQLDYQSAWDYTETGSLGDIRSTTKVEMNFQLDSCTLQGQMGDTWTDGPTSGVDSSYEAIVTDGVHSLRVSNGATLQVCGRSFWELLDGANPTPQLDVGWAELDGVGQVVMLSTWEVAPGDSDGDGWPGSMGDCDDANPAIHPCAFDNAGVDNNCDGQVDSPPVLDQDGDGVEAGVDCNDFDAAIFPGASDAAADGVDSNCDGLEWCHTDVDGDGQGAPDWFVYSSDLDCLDIPESYNGFDCKDSDANVHVGAPELPGNGVDDNCDGVED